MYVQLQLCSPVRSHNAKAAARRPDSRKLADYFKSKTVKGEIVIVVGGKEGGRIQKEEEEKEEEE